MPPETLPPVSVLVSSKDRPGLLREAVASLRALDYPKDRVELVVVEETDQPDDPGADRYVRLPREGRGFAWSRNAALGAASHELVAFTDDDCLVAPGWLRELVAPFEDPEVGAVAGGVLARPSGVLGKTEIVLGFPGGGLRRIAKAGEEGWTPTRELSTVNAAARRKLLVELGGFREETGAYGGEDSELFGRLTEGHRAVFNPRALVFHRARDSIQGIARWLHRRGIAEVALTRLDRPRRRARIGQHLRSSLSLRLLALFAAAVALGLPLALTLASLGLLYYALLLVRYRFALRPMGLGVLLLTPFTKLLMDVSFDAGRVHGFAAWATGRLSAREAPSRPSGVVRASPARVLFVENSGSIVGGGQVSLLQLAARLDRTRFEPFVVCPDEGDFLEAARERGIAGFVVPMPSLRGRGLFSLPGAVGSFIELLREKRIDLVHANGSRAMIYASISARLASRPVLWHVRVLGSDGWLDRILARFSSSVVVNSEAVARRFDFLEGGNGRRGPVVVPNGVDLRPFDEARPDPELAVRWGLSRKHVLVVLAQLIPWKRHELAIDTLALLRRRGVDAALLLVGDEVPATRGYRARLEKKAEEGAVREHCVFAGFRDDVPSILKLSDLLIHTATPEPFGRALIEAMAAGVPLVAAAGGGVEEIVEDGVTGKIVRDSDPAVWADAVAALLRDPALRERMARAGRDRVERCFSIEMHAERMQSLYERLLTDARVG